MIEVVAIVSLAVAILVCECIDQARRYMRVRRAVRRRIRQQ